MGLVEVGVGLIPGGGGNAAAAAQRVRRRTRRTRTSTRCPSSRRCSCTIGTAKVATSAEEAREAGFLTASDGITLNRDFLLADAKAAGARAWRRRASGRRGPRASGCPGRSGAATIDMMLYDMQLNNQISEHDRKIGQKLARGAHRRRHRPPARWSPRSGCWSWSWRRSSRLCGEEKTQERHHATCSRRASRCGTSARRLSNVPQLPDEDLTAWTLPGEETQDGQSSRDCQRGAHPVHPRAQGRVQGHAAGHAGGASSSRRRSRGCRA